MDGDGTSEVVGGAPFDDSAGDDAGLAYLLYGPVEEGVLTSFDVRFLGVNETAAGDTEGAEAGSVVAGAGDINGDGFADLLVGEPGLKYNYLETGGWINTGGQTRLLYGGGY